MSEPSLKTSAWQHGRSALRQRGVRGGIRHILRALGGLARFAIHPVAQADGQGVSDRLIAMWALRRARRRLHPTFRFRGRDYPYFLALYNRTAENERSVEVAVAWPVVQAYAGRPTLEVGNVLSHYFPIAHDVVDKYEQAPGVINEDVVDFAPGRRYDLIVSISTLEHVGWDETPRDPDKVRVAIEHLRTLLAPGGRLLVTFGLGENPHLDAMLAEGRLPFRCVGYLRRVSADNRWVEVGPAEMSDFRSQSFPRWTTVDTWAEVVVIMSLKQD